MHDLGKLQIGFWDRREWSKTGANGVSVNDQLAREYWPKTSFEF